MIDALNPSLARGRRALAATREGLSVASYARRCGRAEQSVRNEIWAYEVFAGIGGGERRISRLVAIHGAPRDAWAALVHQSLSERWTIQETRWAVKAARVLWEM